MGKGSGSGTNTTIVLDTGRNHAGVCRFRLHGTHPEPIALFLAYTNTPLYVTTPTYIIYFYLYIILYYIYIYIYYFEGNLEET